jgi:hypothetical protein
MTIRLKNVLGNAVMFVGNLWGRLRDADLWDFCGGRILSSSPRARRARG